MIDLKKNMLLGVDYYPEQWDINLLKEDLDNIVQLGANVIRIGEFAWHIMEKEEGRYDFSFFDKVIEEAKQKGLVVIFGTPTATPPAWLIKKFPDMLSVFEDGAVREFGGRHVACYSNQNYIDYCKKIVTRLVQHYKNEKAIVAWQIDNELGHEGSDLCWCKCCKKAFNKFLQEKFNDDIDKLNTTYGTAFWSQQYNLFDEIPLPNSTITTHNPSLRLDWERFCSYKIVSFAKMQADIIKNIIPDAVVMHDFPGGGLGKHVDYSDLAKTLDKVAYNNYPVWGGQKEPIKPYEIAFNLDYIRGLSHSNFWITEAIMGAQGHDVTGYLPRPKQAQMWSYQSVARGCDGLMYFRYRGATKGAEQFCYGIIDADNSKGRKFYEVQEFFAQIKNYQKQIFSPIKADVAILYNFDTLSAFRIQRQSLLLDNENEMKKIYKHFYERNIFVDIVPSSVNLDDYKIVVLPNMLICSESLVEKIKKFVANGGCVISTFRTAVKNTDNNLVFGKKLPLDMTDLFGIVVDETESVQEYDCFPLKGVQDNDYIAAVAGVFRDMLLTDGAKTLYRYDDCFYDKYACVTCNDYGKGKAFYLGASPEDKIVNEIVEKAIAFANIKFVYSPEGIEVVRRGENDDVITFVINHTGKYALYKDVDLAPYSVKIIEN